jgi:aminoglycoside 6'-N-acetyltransferase
LSLDLRPLTADDLPLLARWREQPHVRRWWGDPELESDAGRLADPNIATWLMLRQGRPFGFLQDYAVHAWDPHPFSHLPPGARGLDLYVGDPADIGRGHARAVLHRHCANLFAAGVPALGIDPHPDNLGAQRAFARIGFERTGGPVETRWGRAVLMELRPESLAPLSAAAGR